GCRPSLLFPRLLRVKPDASLLCNFRIRRIRNSGLPPFVTHTGHSPNTSKNSCKHEFLLVLGSLFNAKKG
ncbi:MAG: hypothetical protein IJM37_12125, partial [Lachnospiraceae bacterium]|nr:hypothetical protein [Lachnospiraceae bacterium]